MPLQQHLYNGLARPADYSIFEWECKESMLVQEWTYPHGSVLAYGHHGWPSQLILWASRC